jgi:hypothetical protein
VHPVITETPARTPFRGAWQRTVDGVMRERRLRPNGDPRRRWAALADLAADDLDTARLLEAHMDAVLINAELDGPRPESGEYWAAEPPDGKVVAEPVGAGRWELNGVKRWCSGARLCTHALVTAHAPDGARLFAVALDQDSVQPGEGAWTGLGMRRSGTEDVKLSRAVGSPAGVPGAYLEWLGFWFGAISVSACWSGGAVGVARTLWRARDRLDEHGLAHLGAVDLALSAARAALLDAATAIGRRQDHRSADPLASARARALRVRGIVEFAVSATIDRTGRALCPAPLAHGDDHAQRVADLTVYVRQSHAERDLATLGELSEPAAVGL